MHQDITKRLVWPCSMNAAASFVKPPVSFTKAHAYKLSCSYCSLELFKEMRFSRDVSPDWNLAAAARRLSSVEVGKKQTISFHFTPSESRTSLRPLEETLVLKGSDTPRFVSTRGQNQVKPEKKQNFTHPHVDPNSETFAVLWKTKGDI